MKFLLPVGGVVDDRFGILTSPAHTGVPAGIVAGMDWAAENECYTRGWQPRRFFIWLEKMERYRDTCLFVPVPDVVGNARATLSSFFLWRDKFAGWPVAFVAQDGQEALDYPRDFNVLFIGGTTKWKLGDGAMRCIRYAADNGKRVHIGRVNWARRYFHFRALPGSKEFTCDGTRTRFDGTARTVVAWAEYMESSYQLCLHLPAGHCGG